MNEIIKEVFNRINDRYYFLDTLYIKWLVEMVASGYDNDDEPYDADMLEDVVRQILPDEVAECFIKLDH